MPKVSPSKQDADPANPLAPWPPQATKCVDARPPPRTGGGYSPMTATKISERDLGFKASCETSIAPAEPRSIELEKIGQEGLPLIAIRPTMLVMISSVPLMLVPVVIGVCTPRIVIVGTRRWRSGTGLVGTRYVTGLDRALDDLVEFAAIEPDAATLRTVVDLDALAISHD
jgi:hypothetical protein